MQIKWTKRAATNLASILAYIAQDKPSAAAEFLNTTLKKIEQLNSFPELGRIGIVQGSRELIVHKNYIVYYRIKNSNIEIFRVLHTRRKFP